jgi:hypothetical protein
MTIAAATFLLCGCGGDRPPVAPVDSGRPYRLFYYAEGEPDAYGNRLMAVDPLASGLRVSEVALTPAMDVLAGVSGCSANAWDASWSPSSARARAVDPRAIVVTSEDGHLYAVPRALAQAPVPRRISGANDVATVDQCTVWPDVEDFSNSLVIFRQGHSAKYARLADGALKAPRPLPSPRGIPLRDPRTGGLAGYLFMRGRALKWTTLDGRPAETLKSGVEHMDVVGPLGDRYLVLADGDWHAFHPVAGSGERFVSLAAAEPVGWFTGDLTDLGVSYHTRGDRYFLAGQNIGDSFLLSVDFDAKPPIELVTRPSDHPFRLLGRERGPVLGFRYDAPIRGADSGGFIRIHPQSGAIALLGEGGRFGPGLVPTHIAARDKLVFAGAGDRPSAVGLDGAGRKRLGGEDAHVAQRSLDYEYLALTGGSLSRGEHLIYLDGNNVYSVNAGDGSHSGRRLLLGRVSGEPATVYTRAYATGSDAGALLFLERRQGATDLAYIEPRQSGSLQMLVRDAGRAVRPVTR